MPTGSPPAGTPRRTISVRERLAVCADDISETEFAEEWEHPEPFLEVVDAQGSGAATYFEAVTALAFLWFADKPVALAVVEVGMGGSWDATNVVAGDVADRRGGPRPSRAWSTVAEVATEKAGIVKRGETVVVRAQPHPEALSASRDARAKSTRPCCSKDATGTWRRGSRRWAASSSGCGVPTPPTTTCSSRCSVSTPRGTPRWPVVAVEATLGHALEDDATRAAIASVQISGRLEVVGHEPLVVLDGAHNPSGAEALARALGESFTWSRLHVVLAVSSNKDLGGVVAGLAPIADAWYPARNDSVGASPAEEVAQSIAAAGGRVADLGTVGEALAAARDAAAYDDLILVTGSLTLSPTPAGRWEEPPEHVPRRHDAIDAAHREARRRAPSP